MRVVLDTNVLISALLIEIPPPAQLIAAWRRGKFNLLTASPQLEELMRVRKKGSGYNNTIPIHKYRNLHDLVFNPSQAAAAQERIRS